MRRLVFISYRRERGYALAHLVNAELRARGLRTFIDVAESDPGQFWLQAQAALRSCCAVVLICTNGSFLPRAGDDWVLREVKEAIALRRLIVPVFSQDFEPPSTLPSPLAQALECNGVSMDTQFHVAAFDHLSQLVGGRKRSEQRRRVAILASLASLTLLAVLALGARQIIQLNGEARREREARQAANARSEELSQDIAAIEKKRAEAEARQRQADMRSRELEKNLAGLERSGADERQAAAEQQQRAENKRRSDESEARFRRDECNNKCYNKMSDCHVSCYKYSLASEEDARTQCENSCKQFGELCRNGCQ